MSKEPEKEMKLFILLFFSSMVLCESSQKLEFEIHFRQLGNFTLRLDLVQVKGEIMYGKIQDVQICSSTEKCTTIDWRQNYNEEIVPEFYLSQPKAFSESFIKVYAKIYDAAGVFRKDLHLNAKFPIIKTPEPKAESKYFRYLIISAIVFLGTLTLVLTLIVQKCRQPKASQILSSYDFEMGETLIALEDL